MRATHLSIIAAIALSLALAPGAYASKAVHVSCGQTITKDTKLANDLTDCPDNGLVIGADDITLDLNSHTIDGDGRDNLVEDCPDFHCDTGIDSTAHHHGITIQDGEVQEFSSGVWIEGGAGHRLRHLSLSRNGDGMDVALATDTVLTQSSVEGNVFGIWIGGSDNIRIERNTVLDYQGCGVEVQHSDRVLIERNSVFSNDPGAPIAGDACGIGLFNGSAHNRIERNSVSGNGFVGVFVAESDGNEVAANHIFRNRDAVIVQGNANTLHRNRVVDALGADDGSGFGIVLEGGQDNLIAANTIDRTAAAGIWVDVPELDLPTVGNVLRLNQVREAGTDGVSIGSTATDTLLERNFAEGAGDDGFDVESGATTLTRNMANHNDDLGIEAVPGVADGGANRARGNGNPLQCTNVFCE